MVWIWKFNPPLFGPHYCFEGDLEGHQSGENLSTIGFEVNR